MKRFFIVSLDYSGCYYEGDEPSIKVTFYATLEEARKARDFSEQIFDVEKEERVF